MLTGAALTEAEGAAVAAQMRAKLEAAFAPSALELIDESGRHAGHGAWREGGASHFVLRMTSESFAGMSRIARHRAVSQALAEELEHRVHALSMVLEAP